MSVSLTTLNSIYIYIYIDSQISPPNLEVSLKHQISIPNYFSTDSFRFQLSTSNLVCLKLSTDCPSTDLSHQVLPVSVTSAALTKILAIYIFTLSHTHFQTQFISKSYWLYSQNRYQIQLFLTTPTNTILVQATIMCHTWINTIASMISPASTYIINLTLSYHRNPRLIQLKLHLK